jgi:hypothetical protein
MTLRSNIVIPGLTRDPENMFKPKTLDPRFRGDDKVEICP